MTKKNLDTRNAMQGLFVLIGTALTVTELIVLALVGRKLGGKNT